MKGKSAIASGQIVASRPWKTGAISIRYPKTSDWRSAREYINNLSRERTFILMQGNQVTQKQEREFLESALLKIKQKTGIHLFLVDEKNIIGSAGISLKRLAEKHVGVLGLSVAGPYRGYGVGTWFLKTLIDEAKLRLPDLSVVTLEVFANNTRAKHVYEKLGFREYGRLPNGLKYGEEMVDSVSMYLAI